MITAPVLESNYPKTNFSNFTISTVSAIAPMLPPLESQSQINTAAMSYNSHSAATEKESPIEDFFSELGFPTQPVADVTKPRQIVGESVFNQFVPEGMIDQEFPLNMQNTIPPPIGTISPMELHSVTESIFSAAAYDSTPMIQDSDEFLAGDLKPLFNSNEMDVPDFSSQQISQAPAVVKCETFSFEDYPPTGCGSPNFTTAHPNLNKRSFSATGFEVPSIKRSGSTEEGATKDVGFSRKKRLQPLPEIIVDSTDVVAQKRARNTEAARRSRARKNAHMEELEERNRNLKMENAKLLEELQKLRALLAAP